MKLTIGRLRVYIGRKNWAGERMFGLIWRAPE